VNNLKEKEKDDDSAGFRESLRSSVNSRKSRDSVAPSVVGEEEGDSGEKTELGKVQEGEEDEDEGTVVGEARGVGDSLVDELLSDGDVEMSGL
jgi:condensin complex subunit 3